MNSRLTLTLCLVFALTPTKAQTDTIVSLHATDINDTGRYSIEMLSEDLNMLFLRGPNGMTLDSLVFEDPVQFDEATLLAGSFLAVEERIRIGTGQAIHNASLYVIQNARFRCAFGFSSLLSESTWDPPPYLASSDKGDCTARQYSVTLDTTEFTLQHPIIVLRERRDFEWRNANGKLSHDIDSCVTRLEYNYGFGLFVSHLGNALDSDSKHEHSVIPSQSDSSRFIVHICWQTLRLVNGRWVNTFSTRPWPVDY